MDEALSAVDAQIASAVSAPADRATSRTRAWIDRVLGRRPEPTSTWRDKALAAELAGDLVRAAELHERQGDALRAAHLFERAAAEASGSASDHSDRGRASAANEPRPDASIR